jgi:hypothetical protein
MSFAATHVVGEDGAWAWGTPDPAAPRAPSLDPRLPVQLVEQRGDWVLVRCQNGWETWTDGRRLRPVGSAAASIAPAAATPAYRVLAPLGGALAAIGTFLPWYRAGGFSVNAWDLPLWGLLANDPASTSGPKAGLPIIIAGIAIAALFWRPPGLLLIALGCLATNTAVFGIARWLFATEPRPDLGPGAPVAFLGGGLIIVAGWLLAQPVLARFR